MNSEQKRHAAAMSASNKRNEAIAQNNHRRELLRVAKVENVGIVHIFNPDFPYGGMTVAFTKSNKYASGVMVDVAVATCSKEDTFSKKIGTTRALELFFSGSVIQLPLLNLYSPEDINFAVKRAFESLYHSGVL